MKVCVVFESNGECNDCLFVERDSHERQYCNYKFICDYDAIFEDCLCPTEGKRPDCPYIECEGILKDLQSLGYAMDSEGRPFLYLGLNDDSIKFIKACEDNQ